MSAIKPHHSESYHLSGKVKSVNLQTFEAKNVAGKIRKGDKVKDSFFGFKKREFNAHGYLTKMYVYDHAGKLQHEYVYKYCNKHRLIEQIIYTEEGILDRTEYYYNDKGTMINCKGYYKGEMLLENFFYYYYNGHYDKSHCYDSDGVLRYITFYKINDKGLDAEYKRVKPDGRVVSRFESLYDDQNREVERIFTVSDNWHKIVIRYDIWHNEIEEIRYLTECMIDKHYINKYRFDNYNNWIEKTAIENGVFKEIAIREIEYY